MLKVKRQPEGGISLVLRERIKTSDRILFHAFCYSLFIHFFFFFCLHVKPFQEKDSPYASSVFLDLDEERGAFLSRENGQEDSFDSLFTKLNLLTLSQEAFPSSFGELAKDFSGKGEKPLEIPQINSLPWDIRDDLPSTHTARTFPLKITLHQGLHDLRIISDGSQFFKKSSYDTLFFTPTFSKTLPKVQFRVQISLDSGKIIEKYCRKELSDTRLQNLAASLLDSFRFAPSGKLLQADNKTIVEGTISLQFGGTFDTISTLLEGSLPHD